jgi:hypothetical protein
VLAGCCALPPAHAQNAEFDKPLETVGEDVTAFAFAPDGRIVYSVRRLVKTKKYDLEKDDIWLQEKGGRRRRIFQGDKFVYGDKLFTYMVDGFRWSPNGRMILAQLRTTTVEDDGGKTQDSTATLVLDDNGKEIRVGRNSSVIPNSWDAFWLKDNATIVYMKEVVPPHILYSFYSSNIATGQTGLVFEGRTFLGGAPLRDTDSVIGVERDRNLSGPPRLQRLEMLAQDNQELATLDDYEGGISVSPSGKRAAYFIDKEVLEIRDLQATGRFARIRVGIGTFDWSPDETRILLKRGPGSRSSQIGWVRLPALAAHPANSIVPVTEPDFASVLHGLTFRDFAISPDGRVLAVVTPGGRNLTLYPLPE